MSSKLAKIIADFETQLSTKIAVGATTGNLQSAVDDDGVALPNGTYFFTIDKDNSQKEHFVATLTGSALSGLKSISRQGVQTSGAVREHRIGSSVTITDFAHILYMNDLLAGLTAFDSAVKLGYDADPSLISSDLLKFATVAYANALAIAGAPDASTTVKGIVEEATNAEIDANTAAGATSARLFVNPYYLSLSKYGLQLPSAGEKLALVGTSGTPGSANKYVTNDDTSATSSNNKVARYGASGMLKSATTAASVAGDVVALDAANKLPAVDGSNLTNINYELSLGVGSSGKAYRNYMIPVILGGATSGLSAADWVLVSIGGNSDNISAYRFNYGTSSANAGQAALGAIVHNGLGTQLTFAGAKKIITSWNITLNSAGTNDVKFGLMEAGNYLQYNTASKKEVCFSVKSDGTLWAHTSGGGGGTNHTETQITGITLTNNNLYRIEWNPGTSALFYVNGVLKATITTNLPTSGNIYIGKGNYDVTNYVNAFSAPFVAVQI